VAEVRATVKAEPVMQSDQEAADAIAEAMGIESDVPGSCDHDYKLVGAKRVDGKKLNLSRCQLCGHEKLG